MFSHIHVITRKLRGETARIWLVNFFLIDQFFILKNVQPKIYFCFLDVGYHWPGLIRDWTRKLCAFLLFVCAACCAFILILSFSLILFWSGAFPCFFACAITKLVIYFFLLFYFCIYWHVVTSALRIFLFACLLIFLLFTILHVFACLLYFFCALLCFA